MKKSLLALSLALALSGAIFQMVSAPARAAESGAQRAARASLLATYRKSDRAMIKKDVAALTADLAPDYQVFLIRGGRVLNRAQTIALTQQMVTGSASGATLNCTQCSTRILSLAWRGKDAIVMAQTTAAGTVRKGNRAARIEEVTVARDYWTPTSQGWKVRQSVERVSKVWVNGKRVN